MSELSVVHQISLIGFVLGILFGATAQKTHFCTMGAISDIFFFGDWNRMRAWILAMTVAMLGSQFLHIKGIVDLSESIYLSPNLGWFGAVLGGLMFGFGMTLGGGCGNKTLVRLGAGNLKSLVVALCIGLFAYMTLRGIIGLARVSLETFTVVELNSWGFESQGLPDFLSIFGLSNETCRIILLILLAGGGLVFCFKCGKFRASKIDIIAGFLIGLSVPVAWYVTGVFGYDDFEPTPLASLSFIAPVGEGVQYLMTFTGSTINFGIAVVAGVIFGSFLAAKIAGEFKIEAFNGTTDMIYHIFGGALMGIGGVLALGCTIGQGVTGLSTLAMGSFIALFSILLGGLCGMKYLEEGTFKGAIRGLFIKG